MLLRRSKVAYAHAMSSYWNKHKRRESNAQTQAAHATHAAMASLSPIKAHAEYHMYI